MTITTSFSVGPSFAASDVADENDARNRREAKQKLVNNPPLMRQAERKNSEKLLSDALQLASIKAQQKSQFDCDSKFFAQRALKSNYSALDSVPSERLVDVAISNENKVQSEQATTAVSRKEQKPLELADYSKKMLEIESSLFGGYQRANSSEILEKIKNFFSQVKDLKSNPEFPDMLTNKANNSEFDLDSVNCSINFIGGYCEASSFSVDMKKNISAELNNLKSLLNSIDDIDLSAKLPDAVIETVALKIATENAQKSFGSKPAFDENKSSPDKRKEAKNREDTLPLATLRSI